MDSDPEETDGQSARRAVPAPDTVGALTAEVLAQFSGLIAQMVRNEQSRLVPSKAESGDSYLHSFLRLDPGRFKGAVEPRVAEDWLLRVEKTFDGMDCPVSRKVPLAVFMLDGEAERWWASQRRDRSQQPPLTNLKPGQRRPTTLTV